MKQIILMFVAIFAMAGITNSQTISAQPVSTAAYGPVCDNGCSQGQCGPDGCEFGICLFNHFDCEVDRNHCGSIGNSCPVGFDCRNSLCILDCVDSTDPACGGGDIGPILPEANPVPPLTVNAPLQLVKRKRQRLI